MKWILQVILTAITKDIRNNLSPKQVLHGWQCIVVGLPNKMSYLIRDT